MRLAPQQTLLLGPPGCGKTTALLQLVEEYLARGTPAARVAFFSFTKQAVEVARARAMERFSMARDELPYFRTLHSMTFALNGHRKHDVLAREHYRELGEMLGIEFSPKMKIDESTGMPLGQAEGDLHVFVDTLARARGVSLFEQWSTLALRDCDFRAVERTIATIARYKDDNALIDYTDMLERYVENGAPLDIDVAFIDEAQDLSPLQWRALRRMLADCPAVYLAGDDDQAIFQWSGADVAQFLALDGEQRHLTQSFRCPTVVHTLAHDIAARIERRFVKDWQPRPDARGTLVRVMSLDALDLTQFAGTTLLLARNSYLLASYVRELRKQGLVYTTGYGRSSVRADHARAIIAWTRMQHGGHAQAGEVRAILSLMRNVAPVDDPAGHESFTCEDLHARYGVRQYGFWYDALDAISGDDQSYYRSILRAGRKLNAEPQLHVSTIHSAKGGEADNVVLLSDMAARSYDTLRYGDADEEHRVAYVAVSRARATLCLVEPRTDRFYAYM